MKKITFILICLIIMSCNIVGCSNKNTAGVTNTATADSAEIESNDVFLTDVGYCKIAYPTKWEECVIIDSDTKTDVVSFFAILGENKVPLFDISFNDDSNATKVGSIITDKGNVTVSITMHEYDMEKYTSQYYNQYCAMCDDINVIIKKLHEMYNFQDIDN